MRMDKITAALKRGGIILACLLPSACHGAFTSPWLFNHGSSAAFEASIGIWVLDISLLFYALLSVFTGSKGG